MKSMISDVGHDCSKFYLRFIMKFLNSYSFFLVFTECGNNSHVNNLIGNKNRSVPGWTLTSITNGPWNVRSGGDYNHCSKGETWFGWASGQLTGSITTKLKGCGKALLDVGKFGYSRGVVK